MTTTDTITDSTDSTVDRRPVPAWAVGRCPECPTGLVVPDGPTEPDTGHQPHRCTRCRWTA